MTTTAGEPAQRGGAFRRLVGQVSALGRHRVLVTVLVVATIAGALVLDVAFPSYPIAGFYLVPVTLAALTLRVRATVVVALVCLGLGLSVIIIQDRFDGPTITVVCFSALGGAALIALSYLFKEVDQLYENERSTTEMLESLAAQLQTLQEVVVLDSDRPLSDLLGRVIDQASQLLGSDGCRVYRFDPQQQVLRVAAASGAAPAGEMLSIDYVLDNLPCEAIINVVPKYAATAAAGAGTGRVSVVTPASRTEQAATAQQGGAALGPVAQGAAGAPDRSPRRAQGLRLSRYLPAPNGNWANGNGANGNGNGANGNGNGANGNGNGANGNGNGASGAGENGAPPKPVETPVEPVAAAGADSRRDPGAP